MRDVAAVMRADTMACLPPHAGINDFPNASAEDVAKALPTFAAAGVPLLAHAELLSELPPSQVGRRETLQNPHVECAW